MIKFLLLTLSFVFSFSLLFSQKSIVKSVYFETNQSALSEHNKKVIKNEYKFYAKHNLYKVEIQGFTDSIGSKKYNHELSIKRAHSVRKQLAHCGLDTNLIICFYNGELTSGTYVNLDKQDSVLGKNRRVDIKFYYKPEVVIDKLFKLLKTESEVFEIDPTKDTILQTSQNKFFVFRANSFKTNSSSEVTISIRDLSSRSNMILNNVSTMSNEKVLESGGMVEIIAFQEGKRLPNELSKSMDFIIPTKKFIDSMQLFYGTQDSIHGVDWDRSNPSNNVSKVFRPDPMMSSFEFFMHCKSMCQDYCDLPKKPTLNLYPKPFEYYDEVKKYSEDSMFLYKSYRMFQALRSLSKFQVKKKEKYLKVDTLAFIIQYAKKDEFFIKSSYFKVFKRKMKFKYYDLLNQDSLLFIEKFEHKLSNKTAKKFEANLTAFISLKKQYATNTLTLFSYEENKRLYDVKYKEYRSCFELDSLCKMSKQYQTADSLYRIALRKKWIKDSTEYRIKWVKDSTEKSIFFKNIMLNNPEVGNLQYFLQSSSIGFVNCDFFASFSGPKTSLKFTPIDENTNIKLVFPKRMIVMKPSFTENSEYEFLNIPIGEEVIAVALNYEFEEPSYYKENILVKDSMSPIPIKLKKCSIDELKKEVKKLD